MIAGIHIEILRLLANAVRLQPPCLNAGGRSDVKA